MIKELKTLVSGFDLDVKAQTKVLIEDSNACSAEWVVYSLLEPYLRDETIKIIFVASQQFYSHYQTVFKKMFGLNL